MKKWEVYWAYVKFEEIVGGKRRPVLVIDDAPSVTVICLKMTGQAARPGEYSLIKWKEAGLKEPTVVRISKRLELKSADLRDKIGTLELVDIANLKKMI